MRLATRISLLTTPAGVRGHRGQPRPPSRSRSSTTSSAGCADDLQRAPSSRSTRCCSSRAAVLGAGTALAGQRRLHAGAPDQRRRGRRHAAGDRRRAARGPGAPTCSRSSTARARCCAVSPPRRGAPPDLAAVLGSESAQVRASSGASPTWPCRACVGAEGRTSGSWWPATELGVGLPGRPRAPVGGGVAAAGRASRSTARRSHRGRRKTWPPLPLPVGDVNAVRVGRRRSWPPACPSVPDTEVVLARSHEEAMRRFPGTLLAAGAGGTRRLRRHAPSCSPWWPRRIARRVAAVAGVVARVAEGDLTQTVAARTGTRWARWPAASTHGRPQVKEVIREVRNSSEEPGRHRRAVQPGEPAGAGGRGRPARRGREHVLLDGRDRRASIHAVAENTAARGRQRGHHLAAASADAGGRQRPPVRRFDALAGAIARTSATAQQMAALDRASWPPAPRELQQGVDESAATVEQMAASRGVHGPPRGRPHHSVAHGHRRGGRPGAAAGQQMGEQVAQVEELSRAGGGGGGGRRRSRALGAGAPWAASRRASSGTAGLMRELDSHSQRHPRDPGGHRGDRRPDQPAGPQRRHRGRPRRRGGARVRGGGRRGAQAGRAQRGGGQGDRHRGAPGAATRRRRQRSAAPGRVGDPGRACAWPTARARRCSHHAAASRAPPSSRPSWAARPRAVGRLRDRVLLHGRTWAAPPRRWPTP